MKKRHSSSDDEINGWKGNIMWKNQKQRIFLEVFTSDIKRTCQIFILISHEGLKWTLLREKILTIFSEVLHSWYSIIWGHDPGKITLPRTREFLEMAKKSPYCMPLIHNPTTSNLKSQLIYQIFMQLAIFPLL